MKVAVFGANGFIGRAVTHEMRGAGHDVVEGTDSITGESVDLLNQDAVTAYLHDTKPEVIINCAGVVAGGDFENNVRFTKDILNGVKQADIDVKRVIVTGSAGEYGQVSHLPVSEDTELNATSAYAVSKIKEEQTALGLAEETDTSVVVARVFNPLGPGMHERFLVSGLLKQIRAIKDGQADHIEISRLDAARDYLAVSDTAVAFRLLAEGEPREKVYNIGSGVSSTNGQLLDLLLAGSTLEKRPEIVETMSDPEPQTASQADVSRIEQEFGWRPSKSLPRIIEEIINASTK